MSRFNVQSLVALILTINLGLMSAAGPSIGVAQANGDFSIDGAKVTGNATLFEGSRVETGNAASRLQLGSGTKVQLASNSRGRVYRDHLILENGSGQFQAAKDYQVEVLSLRIAPAQGGSSAKVIVKNSNKVQVSALNGAVSVTNRKGILVANLMKGTALEFTPQEHPGAPAMSTMTGCLRKHEAHYLLTDETSNVTVELKGAELEKNVHHRIRITGTGQTGATPYAGATQLIQVSTLETLGGCKTHAFPAGAAIVAGIVVAGAAIGTAVAVHGGGGNTPLSPSAP